MLVKLSYEEIQKTGVLTQEKELLNQQNLEVLYKVGYAQGAVDLSDDLARQSQQLLSQIIEGRVKERRIRKKAFVNDILETYARVYEITGTVLSLVGYVYPPAKAGATLAFIQAGYVRGIQAAYNGDWKGAMYQIGMASLKALAIEYGGGGSIFGFSPDQLKLLNEFQIGLSTAYNTYNAYKSENYALAFVSLAKGVADIAEMEFQVEVPGKQGEFSLDKSTLSALQKGIITLGQTSLSIYNTAQAIDNKNWLAAIKSVSSIASQIDKNFQSDIKDFTKENLKDIYDLAYADENSSSNTPEKPDDSFIGQVKSLIQQGKDYYNQAEDLLKENIGLDFKQIKQLYKTTKKLYDSVDILYDAHVDGSYQSWYGAINKTIGLWGDEIKQAYDKLIDPPKFFVNEELIKREIEKAIPDFSFSETLGQKQNNIYLVDQDGNIYEASNKQESQQEFKDFIPFGQLTGSRELTVKNIIDDAKILNDGRGLLSFLGVELPILKKLDFVDNIKGFGKVGGTIELGLNALSIVVAPTDVERHEAILEASGSIGGSFLGSRVAIALALAPESSGTSLLIALGGYVGANLLKSQDSIQITPDWKYNLVYGTENYGLTYQEKSLQPDGSTKEIETYNSPNSGYLIYTTTTSADKAYQSTTVRNGKDLEQKETLVSETHFQNDSIYQLNFYANSNVKNLITLNKESQTIKVEKYDSQSNLISNQTYQQNSNNIPVDILRRVRPFIDPVVIDLNNDGIKLISARDSSTFFDIDRDGYAENTAWVSPEDGILTIDLNHDGKINNITEIFSERYGNGTAKSGLEALATLDSNKNGIISAADDQFNQILVWQDLNQNGISEANELKTLTQLGITSITLNGIPTETIQDGNIIRTRSLFNRNDGTIGQIADVAFLVTQTGFKVTQTPNGIQIIAENDSATSLSIFNDNLNHTLNLAEAKVQVAIGSTGNDTFYTTGSEGVFLSGGDGNDTLTGGSGNDWIIGDTGADQLYGNAGNDILYIDAEDSKIDGGEGQDIAIVTTNQAITLDLGLSNLEMALGNDGNDTFTNTSTVSVTIDGGKGDDTIQGGSGDDVLTGGEGSDRLQGNLGNDDLEGSDGNDTLDGNQGDDTLNGGNGDDLLNGQEGKDILNGNGGNDTLNGGDDNDLLNGGEGNDSLNGSAGDDSLNGDIGNDILNGGDGNDTLNAGDGDDTLNGGNGSDRLIGGIGQDFLNGGDNNDTLEGGDGNDTLNGGDGDDILTDTLGNDQLNGGLGNDTIDGGEGNDTLSGSNGNDSLNGGLGDDNLDGGSNNDTLNGGEGNDTLTGAAGNDTLIGGLGDDILTGGTGADTFIFQFGQSSISASDRITDFAISADIIDLLIQGGLAMNAPSNFSRAANSTAATLQNLVNQVFADANGASTGNQALGINSAALVQVTSGAIAGTYLVINDSTAGFQADSDLLVNITGMTGTLPALGSITVSSFFV